MRFRAQAVIEGKLKLLPLFHYDPRRWQGGDALAFQEVGPAGLTQFLKSSWCLMAADPKTQLGQYARQRKWVEEKEILASEKHVRLNDGDLPQRLTRLENAQQSYQEAMKASQSTRHRFHSPVDPPRTVKRPFIRTMANYQSLLALREDGRMSILTAAESMGMNFHTLQKGYGFKVDSLSNPFELARVAYMLHFLGPKDAADLALGKMSEDHAKRLLLNQFGGSEAVAISLKYLASFLSDDRWRDGLWKFAQYICNKRMDDGFNKYCKPNPTPTDIGRNLSDILEAYKP